MNVYMKLQLPKKCGFDTLILACSRLRDSGEKSFSKKKCEKRAGAGERRPFFSPPPSPFSRARLIFALLVLIRPHYTVWEPGTGYFETQYYISPGLFITEIMIKLTLNQSEYNCRRKQFSWGTTQNRLILHLLNMRANESEQRLRCVS